MLELGDCFVQKTAVRFGNVPEEKRRRLTRYKKKENDDDGELQAGIYWIHGRKQSASIR